MDRQQPAYGGSAHYQDEAGRRYFERQSLEAEAQGRLKSRWFAGHCQPTDTVLDFGCGTGGLLHALPCARRIGVDFNPEARRFCQERFGIAAHASVEELPDASVDLAISNHALEHVPFPIAALREVRRVLKDGGRFVLCVPLDDWRTQRRYDPGDINHHLHTWTPLLLGHTLHEAGFTAISTRVLTHAWPPGHQRLRRVLPGMLFDAVCFAHACLVKRRQILAIARRS